jgi:hypothetical protein
MERSGVPTGIRLADSIDATRWMEGVLGKSLPSSVAKAGGFGGCV